MEIFTQLNLNLKENLPDSYDDLVEHFQRVREDHVYEIERIKDHYRSRLQEQRNMIRMLAAELHQLNKSEKLHDVVFNEIEISESEPIADMAMRSQDEEESADDQPAGKDKKKRNRRPSVISKSLPRVVKEYDLSESEKICPNDGASRVRIGEEVREEIEIVPAHIIVHRHVTPKYSCPKCHDGVVSASTPPGIIPGSMATPSFLSHLIVSKFEDHLPFFRQEKIFERMGLEVSRTTMARWCIAVAQMIRPLINCIKDEILDSDVIQCDETPLQMLTVDGNRVSKKTYMWVMGRWGPDRKAVLYEYHRSRSGEAASTILGEYAGYLQVDGYKGYDSTISARANKRIGCMAHVRRRFVKALKIISKTNRADHPASAILHQISKLYKIEKEIQSLSLSEQIRVRQDKALEEFVKLEHLIKAEMLVTADSSLYGKALYYAIDELPKIRLYLKVAGAQIDNNLIENAIRPFALGRKNWLFSCTEKGAEASASLYSLIQTAKHNGHRPGPYLRSVLEKIQQCKTLSDVEALLPWNMPT